MCEHNRRNIGQSYCAYCRVNEQDKMLKELRELAEMWTRQGGFIHVKDAGLEVLDIVGYTHV